jgi:hypothetical protein
LEEPHLLDERDASADHTPTHSSIRKRLPRRSAIFLPSIFLPSIFLPSVVLPSVVLPSVVLFKTDRSSAELEELDEAIVD